jgi:acyl carrier protein
MTNQKIEETIKNLIAQKTGVETEEIALDDSLKEDLSLSSADIAELLVEIKNAGLPVEAIDIGQIETLGDLVEQLSTEDEL